jgi:hypothetical protein
MPEAPSLEVKRSGRSADHSLASHVEFSMSGALRPIPSMCPQPASNSANGQRYIAIITIAMFTIAILIAQYWASSYQMYRNEGEFAFQVQRLWNRPLLQKRKSLDTYSESRDSLVGILTGYGSDGRSSIPGREKRFFSTAQCHVQTGPGADPAFCQMGTGRPSPGAKSETGQDLGSIQPCIRWVPGALTTHLHLVMREQYFQPLMSLRRSAYLITSRGCTVPCMQTQGSEPGFVFLSAVVM